MTHSAVTGSAQSPLKVSVCLAGYDFSRRCIMYNIRKIAQDVCGCYRWHRSMCTGLEHMESWGLLYHI